LASGTVHSVRILAALKTQVPLQMLAQPVVMAHGVAGGVLAPPVPPVSAVPFPPLPPVATPVPPSPVGPLPPPPPPPPLGVPPPSPPIFTGVDPQPTHALLAARKRTNVLRIIQASFD
jgi:hypothetical protein